jgi:hypothetical protein
VTPKAQVEQRGDDPWGALEFLAQARRFLRDGRIDDLSDEGRQVLLHNAAVAACDAILAINGLDVTGSEGGHLLRFEEAHKRLGGGHGDLFERLEDGRDRRIQASYRAGSLDGTGVDVGVQAVGELIDLAETLIEPRLPEWGIDR